MKATLVGELTGRIYHSSCKPYLKEKGVTKEAVRKIAKEYKTIRRRAKDIGAKNMTSAYVMGIYFVAMNRESGLSAEENYEVFYQVIDGQSFVPQHRERILIVGFDKERYGDNIEFEFDIIPKEPKPVIKDILESNVDDKYTLSDKLWVYLQNYAAKHKAAGNGFGYGIAPLDGVARTLSARYYKDGSEVLIEQPGKNPRKLTPRECARLQGFPDSFIIPVSDTQAYKQFGNSVVVPLMECVAKLIMKKIVLLDFQLEEQYREAM